MGKRPEVPFYMEWPVSPSDRGSLVTILRPVGQNKDQYKPKYHFQLGEREYSAIGFATVHWAFLEEALYKRTVLFARRARVRVPEDAHDLSFSRRIGALRVLVRTAVKDPKRRKWWSLVISRIGNENGIRQKIVHGLWSYDPRRPDRLFSSPRPSIGRWMEPFSDEKLSEFGQRVGELSFELLHPQPWTSPGPSKYRDGDFAYASRSFRLRLAGKFDALGFPQPIPVNQPHPPEPSQASPSENKKPKDR